MLDWRIYYADGTTFSGDALAAPYKRIAFILTRHPDVGRRFLHGTDAYVWHRQWLFCDLWSAFDRVNEYPGEARAFRGQWLHDDEWETLWERGMADPDFPAKGGYTPDERKG